MKIKQFILSAVGVFVFVFLYDFVVHGILLKELYIKTSSVWRSESEQLMIFMFISQICFSAVMALLYFCCDRKTPSLGIMIGLLLGSIQIGTYAYMPIPLTLTIYWVIAAILKGTGAGLILSISSQKPE